jgi:isopenicillin-N epimerase
VTSNPLRSHWTLDPEVTFLNHGSFGACPKKVLERQDHFRRDLESEPVRFFLREYEGHLDASRAELASFVGAPASDLVFLSNATTAVNTVFRSLELAHGDEILVTSHAYNACRNAIDYAAERRGAKVLAIPVPFPLASPDEVVDAVLSAVTSRTRIALIDHVTSPTGLVLPIEPISKELHKRNVDVFIDGAHAPGMVPLHIERLGMAYYTGNCHKWICAPKGAGFLYVRPDRQERIRPLTISHGANSNRRDRSRFQVEFDWMGTGDVTAQLCVGEAIRHLGGLVPGGWEEIRRRNRDLALQARELLCSRLEIETPAPDEMIGSLAALPLPDAKRAPSELFLDPLQEELWQQHRIEIPVQYWPAFPKRLIRLSAAIYNHIDEYPKLADALSDLLAREGGRRD